MISSTGVFGRWEKSNPNDHDGREQTAKNLHWRYEIPQVIGEECERLQGLPDDFTPLAYRNTRRYAMLGNGFTVPVISHILQPTIEGSV